MFMSIATSFISKMRAGISGLAVAALLAGAAPAMESDLAALKLTAYKQALAEGLAAEDVAIAEFYRSRDFAPIWTGASDADRARRAALLDAFSMAGDHGLPERRFDADAVMRDLAAARTGRDRGALEIRLSKLYIDFANALQSGLIDPRGKVEGVKRSPPRRDASQLLARLVQDDPQAAFRGLAPTSPEYTRLVRVKLMLERTLAQGGWGPTVPGTKIEPGETGPAVVALRNRLMAMGYLGTSLSADYDDALRNAVMAFQASHGLEQDGVAGGATLAAINVEPEARLKSIIVAMERERWLNLPDGLGQRHIRVNLTDFHAEIIDDGKLTFQTRSVVGHADVDRRTPEFSDQMEFMVINPSWYVPRSIVVKEYLPLLRRNPNAVGHLQILGRNGPVSRARGFSQYTAASFPYGMRQPPGPKNALGTVKFMFPNQYNIYLHDTPSKHLFAREVRTYSHGCVRLSDPHDFAYALLAKQSDDPQGLFQSILRTGSERRVNLDQPVPVHLIYRTAFTRAKGPVQFRDDVYGRDALVWALLEREGVALRRSGG
ncbi:L,D-transpeptidase family protein [Thalassococcus sp. CAU 1522]|uniref:L,D-transpeptidase family protein n=1 Tax=Thalassococcus arenae TaxID=2851652 RepID=A0ABS6NC55_9RHOB|nr:L,D-transpeptidase family protein [Thalassococcus arenae]MBV2361125.1 L,D-transpeptidase family protein [Thalassococcus arenae]